MSAMQDQVTPRALPEFYPHLADPATRFALTPLVSSSWANGMSEHLKALLTELEGFGETNDQLVTDRRRRMLNITRDTGEFLAVLVRAIRARFTLEIGTSNGYSTLWLAEAARTIGGHVTTVEASEYKAQLAARTFARSGLANLITQM